MLYKFCKWFTAICLPLFFIHGDVQSTEAPLVLVSVEPYTFLVERIAGNTVRAQSLVPPTADIHTYEPTPQQMMRANGADLWFRLGETFETKALPALQAANPSLEVIDLRTGLDLIREHVACAHCQHNHGEDLHLWLSARMLQPQAIRVAEVLIQKYPQHEALYRDHLKQHLQELQALDRDLAQILTPLRGQRILVGHPAYGYLFRDYGLEQLPIEQEGRDPTGWKQTRLIQYARQHKVKAVYTQAQFSPKAASLIAQQLHVPVITLDPFKRDYLQNLRHVAQQFATPNQR